jgi:hypothetical protein
MTAVRSLLLAGPHITEYSYRAPVESLSQTQLLEISMLTRIKVGFLFLTLVIVTATAITITHSQQNQSSSSLKKTINDEDVPITSFNKSLPIDAKEKDKRQKKNQRYNLELGVKTGVFDSRPFMLTEERRSGYGGFDTHAPVEPAIPAATSNLVIIGEVTQAKAFLSEDKVSIYSEFTVNVRSIIKNSNSENINIGDSITISRGGGGVRFPSGKIIKKVFEGKPMPRVGSKYGFFLKSEVEENNYSLITAYESQGNKIVPLDGLDRNGTVIYQLAPHQSYRGASEADFLNLVQFAVSTSQDLFERKEQ